MDERTKLLARIEDPDAPLDVRIEAGERLAALGDPRVTAVDRVLVPAGECLFGDREIAVSAFRIDRYPVTVGAYSAFVLAGGYRDPRLWTARGRAWRDENAITKPRFWDEAEWAPYLVPNHPVVGVSVHEAEAFAAFCGARLPTEAEWERACRFPDDRMYPWGDEWRDDACGLRGYGPRGTVPIGTFPRGRSALGLSDMVGGVWQWCRDVADDDAVTPDQDPFVDPDDYDDEAPRVTRGGAWNTQRWSVHAKSKNAYPPAARFSNLGFRLAEDV